MRLGHCDEKGASFAFGAPDLHAAAQKLDALPDAQEPEPEGVTGIRSIEALALVRYGQANAVASTPESKGRLPDPGVLDHIEQQLLDRLVEKDPERLCRQLAPIA